MKFEISTKLEGKILLFTGSGQPMPVQTYPIPDLKPGEILVRNLYTTLCGSDLHTFCGLRHEKTPTVLGHEIVGQIYRLHPQHTGQDDAGSSLQVGDIVTWTIFSADPDSIWSRDGMPQKSENLFKYGHAQVTDDDQFHGGLAEYCILKANTTVLKIPETVPLPVAATINCAVATVAGALRLAGDLNGKTVLITGMGMLGVVCAAMCKDAGAACVWAGDVSETRLQQSRDFGVDETHFLPDMDTDAIRTQVRSLRGTPGFDVVFDMSGAPDAMETGLNTLALGGMAVWIGAVYKARNVLIDAEYVVRNLLTIKGLHNYNYTDFRTAVDFMIRRHDAYPFRQLIASEFPLIQAQQAFEYAIAHKPFRVGIRLAP